MIGIVTWRFFIAPLGRERRAVNLYLAHSAVRNLQLKATRKPLDSNK